LHYRLPHYLQKLELDILTVTPLATSITVAQLLVATHRDLLLKFLVEDLQVIMADLVTVVLKLEVMIVAPAKVMISIVELTQRSPKAVHLVVD